MTAPTMRELCEAVRDAVSLRDGHNAGHALGDALNMHGVIVGKRMAELILAALDAEREAAESTLAKVARVLRLLDERAAMIEASTRRPAFEGVAPYFKGREVGEMAGTAQAADAIRKALGVERDR